MCIRDRDAFQVADRWHLLANLREALERLLNRNHTVLLSLPHSADKSQKAVEPETTADASVIVAETVKDGTLSDHPGREDGTTEATSLAPLLIETASNAPEARPTQDLQLRQQRRARRLHRVDVTMYSNSTARFTSRATPVHARWSRDGRRNAAKSVAMRCLRVRRRRRIGQRTQNRLTSDVSRLHRRLGCFSSNPPISPRMSMTPLT